jgi:hypothetical protein
MVVVVLWVKVQPDVVGVDDDDACERHVILGGIVEKSRFTSIPCGLVFWWKT